MKMTTSFHKRFPKPVDQTKHSSDPGDAFISFYLDMLFMMKNNLNPMNKMKISSRLLHEGPAPVATCRGADHDCCVPCLVPPEGAAAPPAGRPTPASSCSGPAVPPAGRPMPPAGTSRVGGGGRTPGEAPAHGEASRILQY